MLKDLRAHFRGSLLGFAVGDALGAPLKWLDARAIERKHGRVAEMLGGGRLHLKIGEGSGVTQTMFCVAQSLAARDEFSADDIAARLVAWLNGNPADMSSHARSVLERIAAGADWKSAATGVQRASPQSADNGSLPRGVPVALWDFDDVSPRLEHSRVQSEITHAHQECQWSSALLNSFIFHLMTVGVRDVALDRALAECRDAPGHIRKRLQLAPGKMQSELKPTAYVLDTLDCAVWAFINSENFEDALVSAVNLGGDSDAIGAICGALAGAFYGERNIPARWLETLQNRDEIAQLATDFATRQIQKTAEITSEIAEVSSPSNVVEITENSAHETSEIETTTEESNIGTANIEYSISAENSPEAEFTHETERASETESANQNVAETENLSDETLHIENSVVEDSHDKISLSENAARDENQNLEK